MIEKTKLLEMWPVAPPGRISLLPGGSNKQTSRVDAIDGNSYVLCIVPGLDQLPRARYEAAILERLAQQRPPFHLSLPLQTRQGDIVTIFEQEEGAQSFATLSPLLPGHHLEDGDDLVLAVSAGYTLAWLDSALATLSDVPSSSNVAGFSAFGELAHVHPAVPDPLAALERLPLPSDARRQLASLFAPLQERVPVLYQQLPQQLLHRDYDPSNILVDRRQVTAVLDFEFAGSDLRALDLCVALCWWPVHRMGTGREWGIIDSFGKAYVDHLPLTEQEIRAFPDIMRLRDMTSLIHRIGRYLEGLESEERIQERVEHSLWRDTWLSASQSTLIAHALAW